MFAQSLGRNTGALVASLDDDGPAATSGVMVGDILIELDGAAIEDPHSLREALGNRAGKSVKLVALRAGQRTELDVTLGSKV